MKNKHKKNPFNSNLLLGIILLFACSISFTKANEPAEKDSDCIFCTQFVPECGENEKLVPQTCKKCAHCEPIGDTKQEAGDTKQEAGDTKQEAGSTKQETLSTDTTNTTECVLHAQCPHWHKCIDGHCILRPHRRNPDVVIRKKTKKETQKIAKKAITIPKKVKKETMITFPSENLAACKNPCGPKCCKAGKRCITIDQCKGTKGKCKLPVLKFCSSKPPEKITGRLNPF